MKKWIKGLLIAFAVIGTLGLFYVGMVFFISKKYGEIEEEDEEELDDM